MPFEKVDVNKAINNKIESDKEFANAYIEIEKEYSLIEQVIDARKNVGLTQQELAEKVGVTQQVISRFENEKHTPTLNNFLKILHALDLDLYIDKKRVN